MKSIIEFEEFFKDAPTVEAELSEEDMRDFESLDEIDAGGEEDLEEMDLSGYPDWNPEEDEE